MMGHTFSNSAVENAGSARMSSASASRKKPEDATTRSVRPRRCSTRSRRLPRTESPTSSAPESTATAVATPATTAAFVRQKYASPRRTSWRDCISWLVPKCNHEDTKTRSEKRLALLGSTQLSVDELEANRKVGRELGAVCHDDEDGLLPPVQIQEEGRHVPGRCAIEVARRLVAQQEPRLPDERPRDRDALPLAARQLARAMIEAIAEPHLFDQHAGPFGCASGITGTGVGHERGNQHVLDHRALRQQTVVLKHEADRAVAERRERGCRKLERILAVERHRARGRRLERAEHVQQ